MSFSHWCFFLFPKTITDLVTSDRQLTIAVNRFVFIGNGNHNSLVTFGKTAPSYDSSVVVAVSFPLAHLSVSNTSKPTKH